MILDLDAFTPAWVDVVLDLHNVSPLDGDERLIAVDQLSTKVNVFLCTT